MNRMKRLLVSFGRFWWEFLIGENPDAFIGAIVVIGAALLLRHTRSAAIVIVPILALVILFVSTYRGRKRAAD
jgi:predicted signal transduction protein with EAL and GGDEF domain